MGEEGRHHRVTALAHVAQRPPGFRVQARAAPLEIGGSLRGGLDEIAVYDLTRAPFLFFEDGTETASVVLDAQERTRVRVYGLTVPRPGAALGTSTAAAAAEPARANVFLSRLRMGAVRAYRAPDPPGVWARVAHVGALTSDEAAECLQGLARGEPTGWTGFACEILLGITGVGNV